MSKTNLILLLLFLVLVQFQCKSQKIDVAYNSESLNIRAISKNSYVHVSYLHTTDFGKAACNGLIYINNNEAVVFDTPTSTEVSQELLHWLRDIKNVRVKAVVVNHFHVDCLGGLEAFHDANIPSYSSNKTIELANINGVVTPQIGFDIQNELEIGGAKVINKFFGEAHTKDNIISYISNEELIYGGCMIKSLKASKGNLKDANLMEWSNTTRNIKDAYPKLKTVVPGHGKHGSTELLDYTIELFKID